MRELNDDGFEWRIHNTELRLIMYTEAGYNSTVLECKFCPKCGRDLRRAVLEFLNKKNEEEIDKALTFKERLLKAAEEHKEVLEYLKDK